MGRATPVVHVRRHSGRDDNQRRPPMRFG
jgi:hypothetical protein